MGEKRTALCAIAAIVLKLLGRRGGGLCGSGTIFCFVLFCRQVASALGYDKLFWSQVGPQLDIYPLTLPHPGVFCMTPSTTPPVLNPHLPMGD